jgi:hypothetical protein
MKALLHSISLGAGAAALLALSACQSQEAPTQPSALPSDGSAIRSEGSRVLPEGRKATDEEVAKILAAGKDAPAPDLAPPGPAALAKAAALPTCLVDFNQINALDRLPDDGYRGWSLGPTHYAHSCNGSYYVYAMPINTDIYRLNSEMANTCSVAPNRMGKYSNGACINQNQAIYFPRRAGNNFTNTGVQFYVRNNLNLGMYFDLQAIYIYEGTAKIVGYRPGIGWWVWYPLAAGTRWVWPAGTTVSEIRVFDQNENGGVRFDNLEIGIQP